MRKIRLFDEKKQWLLGSDGVMHLDGRYNHQSIITAVRLRNERYSRNFPHKKAFFFAYTDERYEIISKIFEV